jgi:hypothetical protein
MADLRWGLEAIKRAESTAHPRLTSGARNRRGRGEAAPLGERSDLGLPGARRARWRDTPSCGESGR